MNFGSSHLLTIKNVNLEQLQMAVLGEIIKRILGYPDLDVLVYVKCGFDLFIHAMVLISKIKKKMIGVNCIPFTGSKGL